MTCIWMHLIFLAPLFRKHVVLWQLAASSYLSFELLPLFCIVCVAWTTHFWICRCKALQCVFFYLSFCPRRFLILFFSSSVWFFAPLCIFAFLLWCILLFHFLLGRDFVHYSLHWFHFHGLNMFCVCTLAFGHACRYLSNMWNSHVPYYENKKTYTV